MVVAPCFLHSRMHASRETDAEKELHSIPRPRTHFSPAPSCLSHCSHCPQRAHSPSSCFLSLPCVPLLCIQSSEFWQISFPQSISLTLWLPWPPRHHHFSPGLPQVFSLSPAASMFLKHRFHHNLPLPPAASPWAVCNLNFWCDLAKLAALWSLLLSMALACLSFSFSLLCPHCLLMCYLKCKRVFQYFIW